jgi:CDP-diglyceride synthetase
MHRSGSGATLASMESTLRTTASPKVSTEGAIGVVAGALAVGAMVIDHLINGDSAAFLVTSAIALTVAAVLFGRVIPRTKASADAAVLAARRAMLCSGLAVLSIPMLFAGLPFVLGCAGVALGVLGRGGDRRRLAVAAITLGALVVLFSVGVFAVQGDSDG